MEALKCSTQDCADTRLARRFNGPRPARARAASAQFQPLASPDRRPEFSGSGGMSEIERAQILGPS